MPQPVPARVTSTPSQPGQPYDAESSDNVGRWNKLDENGGPADIHTGRVTGDFESSGKWHQV